MPPAISADTFAAVIREVYAARTPRQIAAIERRVRTTFAPSPGLDELLAVLRLRLRTVARWGVRWG